MSYATVAQLSEYLGLTDDTDDALLSSLIQRAQAMIDAHCKRTFEATSDTTRSFDNRSIAARWLWLDQDICAITSVTNGDATLVANTEYTAESRVGAPWFALRLRDRSAVSWTATDADIAIVGRWAYATSAPADIVHATIRLAAWLYRQRDNAAGDGDRPIVAGNATILPSQIPGDVLTSLRDYRRIV